MDKSRNKSALHESEGTPSTPGINPKSIARIKAFRKKQIPEEELVGKILAGNKTALGRAITLVESHQQDHLERAQKVIEACLPHAQRSVRIGITGVPGVGKSTFIEAFGTYLVSKGKKVAVLAVDPSSSVTHGSIMGDKTRMEKLVTMENAFIRPSPSGDSLGGVAQKTRESIVLCEAAGFDVLLIETVGVGQSETTVHSMTDFFLLLKLAGAGDELQGIKRGIIEMADLIVINKADGENQKAARDARLEFKRALNLYPPRESRWQPQVLLSSAINHQGIPEVWEEIMNYLELVQANGFFEANRHEQNKFWMLQTINEHLKKSFYQHPEIKKELQVQLKAIEQKKTSPFAAAKHLIKLWNEV
ncbi:methylmalonyl Co-A mutase-associated GTPase MeaB [Antarcticibacterium flavum]|uniref:Methylmalonyl Co-A mutase-associated GTPase MeaB n=1 Tax=Antarcticibacterium flavum TaxID=2058175 RepID=A0A5B7X2C9_9FLAO|nr:MULTISPECIES: methylmalonyl Co-A mutase-associated GTPase MeaB [Antarcticibacterium]MCM4160763.1 methylmalonyl Co-A mutase-associated GTPase MeaB [Antarcticibacterium sp. W02-3]QCY68763.1 methylmalonyl Co-A mutase-associated GTPase MeaB [Antarcticibacterium flavum]